MVEDRRQWRQLIIIMSNMKLGALNEENDDEDDDVNLVSEVIYIIIT